MRATSIGKKGYHGILLSAYLSMRTWRKKMKLRAWRKTQRKMKSRMSRTNKTALFEPFLAGLDTDDSVGPPLGYVDDWWSNHDGDDDTTSRTFVGDESDTGC
jgi:hypothetical protein